MLTVQENLKYLIEQKKKVFLFIIIILLIDPWEKQEGPAPFVQQTLDSYLLLQERIQKEDIKILSNN